MISVLAALTPILVAALRTAIHRWVPTSDNGLLLLRTADVATSNHPWLGTWTSASLTAGTNFNNPGPLLFDLLAGPVKVLGYGIGMPLGLALVNGASVFGAALVARRQGGSRAVVAMMLAATCIAWAMGSALLVDPWQPHVLMLPFLFLLALLWGIACGDLVLIPWFAAVASLLVQTHLSYSFLILFFTIGLAAAVVVHARRTPSKRAGLTSIGVKTAIVFVVLWLQSFIEQLFGEGQGNLSRLVSSSSSSQTKIGLKLGTRLIAGVMLLPPWFARWAFVDAVPSTPYSGTGSAQQLIVTGVVSFRIAAPAVVIFVAITALLLWRAFVARLRVVVAALAMVEGLVVCAVVAMIVMPAGILGLSAHQMRWLWTMSAFNLVAVAGSALVVLRIELAARTARRSADVASTRALSTRAVPMIGPVSMVCGVTATMVFAAMACPTFYQSAGPTADHGARDTVAAMIRQMSVLRGHAPLLFDDTGLRFAESYSGAVLAELGQLDVPFEVANPIMVRQVGDGRKVSGRANERLYIREGDEAAVIPPGVDRVVFVPGLSDADLAERDALVETWTQHLADGMVGLSASGQAALASGTLGLSHAQIDGLVDPRFVVEFGLLSVAATQGWLDLAPQDVDELVRLQQLQTQWRFRTVGLFIEPLTS